MLDYKLIEALAVVAQEGGFDRAANILHLTQSAVSQRVKQLEEQLGQVLVVRTTPTQLTAAGRRLLKHYLQVKRLEEDLCQGIYTEIEQRFTQLAVGLNADSLATWFFDAVQPFMLQQNVLLDIKVDDQEQTHQLLKNGDVVGCISTKEKPLQGCRVDYLGRMNYNMLATPEFARHWFPAGLTLSDLLRAPAVIFNRKDELHHKLLTKILGAVQELIPASYVPSAEKFVDFIARGLGYGMIPLQQSAQYLQSGQLVNLAPDHYVSVKLYWHCWNLKSELLDNLRRQLISKATILLDK